MKSRLPKTLLQKYILTVGGVWVVFLATAAAMYGLMLGPQSAQIETLQTQAQEAAEDYDVAQRARRPETRQRIQERLESTTQSLAQFMTSADTASRLTVVISQLASQYHLNDFSVKTRQMSSTINEQDSSGIMEAWLELTFSAPFNSCAAYINALERNQPVIFVESADIQRPRQANEEPTARVLISYLIDAQQSAAGTLNHSPVLAAGK